jgi:hypothetical protein
MNAKTVARFAVVGCALLAASTVLATETFRKLSGSQIHARLAGMEVTDEVHWRDYYLRDGSFKSRSMGLTRVGKWRVKDGELCLDLGDKTDSGCYEVWRSGTKVELRPTGSGQMVQGVLEKPADRN